MVSYKIQRWLYINKVIKRVLVCLWHLLERHSGEFHLKLAVLLYILITHGQHHDDNIVLLTWNISIISGKDMLTRLVYPFYHVTRSWRTIAAPFYTRWRSTVYMFRTIHRRRTRGFSEAIVGVSSHVGSATYPGPTAADQHTPQLRRRSSIYQFCVWSLFVSLNMCSRSPFYSHWQRLDMTHCFDIPLVRSLMQFSCDFRDIDLRNTIICGLTERHPRSLRAWDNIVPIPKTMITEKAYRCQDIDHLRFARDFAIASVFPSLLYQISFCSTLVCSYVQFKTVSHFK